MVKNRQNWLLIKIGGIAFTSLAIFYLTYSGIKADLIHGYYLLTLILQVMITWEGFLLFLQYLDKKIHWNDALIKRLLYQVIGGTFVVLFVFTVIQFMIYPIDKFILNRHRLHGYWDFDIIICFLLAIIIQLIYVIYYFYIHWANNNIRKEFISRIGNRQKVILEDEILCFYTENKTVFAITENKDKHILDLSLEKIIDEVNSLDFFKANRQYIVRKSSIKEINKEPNNRLSIITECESLIPESIIISRKNTPTFRKWFHHTQK
ncbi:LytTR family DNA-binding domain-containing protein [Marinifilum fragile]|uniref:LytR/AlgR family response regulator transcription factor n=1 Tax=Marinifilum fragile TaxID=570161 RepID=UPI002AA7F5F8|nr:LytTR family DNA-binding domain-containing protein [Marinifilum fragile]